jgi:hypothetical protein
MQKIGHGKAVLTLILILFILMPGSVKADEPELRLSGADLAPSIVYLGDAHAEPNDIVMLQLTLNTTHQEGITLDSITFHRSGLASDTEVIDLNLYEDSNLNGELDHGVDEFLSMTTFEMGKAEFTVPMTISPADPVTLLIVMNISEEAQPGNSIGVDIPNADYITIEGPAEIEFVLPIRSKNSTIKIDTEGDLNPDDTDPDDDNDDYMDDLEKICGSDPKDSNSVPEDRDKDHVPDYFDSDNDNDGVPDEYDDFPFDASQQRDYTFVFAYAVLVAVLIIFMIIVRVKVERKMRGSVSKKPSEEEIEEDLEIEEEDIEEESLEEGL